jgi:hypothetical protein
LTTSPGLSPLLQFPTNNCSPNPWGGSEWRGILLEFPWGESERDKKKSWDPGFSRSPLFCAAPRSPGPGPRPPGGSALLREQNGRCLFPTPPSSGRGFPPRLSSSGMRGSRARPAADFDSPEPRSWLLATRGCDRSAAPLTPKSPPPRPPRRVRSSEHLLAREFRFSPFHPSRAERSKGPIHGTALPYISSGLGSKSLRLHVGDRHNGGAPPPLSWGSLQPLRLAYLSWRCTHRTIKLKSYPSASLPRVPAKQGSPKPRRNKCAWIQWRAVLAAAKLASGRQGRWLGSAGCCARGSRPGRQPRPPRPQPAPHRGRWQHQAWALAPAAVALALELRLLSAARPLRQVALRAGEPIGFASLTRGTARTWGAGTAASTTPRTRVGVPGPAAEKEALEVQGFTRSNLTKLLSPLSPPLPPRGGGGC